jgi:hypothetical protein
MSAPPTVTTAPAPASPAPTPQVLVQAAKLAMEQDKPIQLDYYADTALGRAFLGEDSENNERMLVKSRQEFTSSVQKIYKVATDLIIITENSIYVVSGKVLKQPIKSGALRNSTEGY